MVRVIAERDDTQKAPTRLTAIGVLFAPAWRTTSRLRRAELRSIKTRELCHPAREVERSLPPLRSR